MIDLEKIIYASILSNGSSSDPTITTKTGSLSTASANSFVIIPESFENLYAVELEIDGSHEFSNYSANDLLFVFGLHCTNEPFTFNGTQIVSPNGFLAQGYRKTSSLPGIGLCNVGPVDDAIGISSSYTFPQATYTYKLYYKS